ncbi:MAG TPA: hypothetical protein ENN74_00500 [Firmicutes bacterium]|nr:hypothetical protein [Bacillota bacterium]
MKTIRILTGGFGLILYLFAGTLPGYGQPKDTPISTPTSTATPSRTPTSTPTGTMPTLTPTATATEDPKNPPTSTPTTTSTPTPTLSCCEEAVARGEDKGDLGGVVCCDGVKYSCFWPHNDPGLPPEGTLAYQIIES